MALFQGEGFHWRVGFLESLPPMSHVAIYKSLLSHTYTSMCEVSLLCNRDSCSHAPNCSLCRQSARPSIAMTPEPRHKGIVKSADTSLACN